MCFVGQDNHRSGALAGELIAKMVSRPGRVAAIAGNLQFQAHSARIRGFKEAVQRWNSSLEVDVREGFSTDEGTRHAVESVLSEPTSTRAKVVGVYVSTGTIQAALDVLRERTLSYEMPLVASDTLEATKRGLATGEVDFTIFQDPAHQGYQPVKLMYDYLLTLERPETTWFQSPVQILAASHFD
jgi:ABC-type sugar transport system substrate-binding protein